MAAAEFKVTYDKKYEKEIHECFKIMNEDMIEKHAGERKQMQADLDADFLEENVDAKEGMFRRMNRRWKRMSRRALMRTSGMGETKTVAKARSFYKETTGRDIDYFFKCDKFGDGFCDVTLMIPNLITPMLKIALKKQLKKNLGGWGKFGLKIELIQKLAKWF